MTTPARVGIAHHYGWAIAVTVSADRGVVDRRRIELIEPGLPAAPIHHEGGAHPMHQTGPALTDDELLAVVERVQASVASMAAVAFKRLAGDVGPIATISVRTWPDDFPADIATLRRPPYEARADSVMYCQLLAAAGADRGWAVHRYDHRTVETVATAAGVDPGAPRAALGPPWTKDHRLAFAAAVVAS